MKITLADVQKNIANIANRNEYDANILYELLAAYGRSKSAITQLQSGQLNKSDIKGSVLQKDVVYFRTFQKGTRLELEVEKLNDDPLTERYAPRYIITTDFDNLAARDTRKNTTLSIKLKDIDNNIDFFYGWTGDEVVDVKTEAVADRRAADKMNDLYAEIEKENRALFVSNHNFRHELNIFFTRLLFCFFAEDTGIFDATQFSGAIKSFTQADGSDLDWFFGELFKALDTEDKTTVKAPFSGFPYVNGSIFNTSKNNITIPKFNAQARHLILECGSQNWGEINPDIFGTIFQGIVDPEHRDESGMDYTSVPNILKVIEPLFMNELHDLFDKYFDNEKKLWLLLNRIKNIKIFDPACGSGNFLIVSYKELRKLQHAIIARIEELSTSGHLTAIPENHLLNIHNFYGIEIDDFARELAVLSLFLAKHQMNVEFDQQFHKKLSIIPLIDIPTIVCGNAARLDWQAICPNVPHTVTTSEQSALFELEGKQAELKLGATTYDEIYLIGNPPYKGPRWLTIDQKYDTKEVLGSLKGFGNLDYIAIWFYKGVQYISSNSRCKLAFVSTNSISQGSQVELLWPDIFMDHEINFAHQSFKWQNSARDNAGVTVVVISIRIKSKDLKYLFSGDIKQEVKNINAYLLAADDVFIHSSSKPISDIKPLDYGSFALDDGNFTILQDEYDQMVSADSRVKKFLKPFIGSAEFLRGIMRYAVWIDASDAEEAIDIPILKEKINRVYEWRLKSDRVNTKRLASIPWRFAEIRYQEKDCIISPIISSERREYIPMGYLDKGTIVSNAAFAIYDAELWLFALLNSKMHMAWIRTVCGQLETRIRYSSTLGYNTFPVQPLTQIEKDNLTCSARKILLTRENYPEKTLAEMYDPDKMPADLRDAHNENDLLVDRLYKPSGFSNDEERLAVLFGLYERMKK